MRINDIRGYIGVNCGSDHYLLRAKVTFPYVHLRKGTHQRTEDTEEITDTVFNINSMIQDSTQTLYQQRLDQKLEAVSYEASVEEVYKLVVNSLKSTVEEALGKKTRNISENLWWGTEIEKLVLKKKRSSRNG